MNLSTLNLPDEGVVAIVGGQWGDEGKGKIVDLVAEWADVIARGTGGANAGHTIVVDGEQHVFHLMPSAILRDAAGKMNVIGSGVAFDPVVMLEEMAVLDKLGVSYGNLRISRDARLVLPHQIVLDQVRELIAKGGRVGTTGRGIGPVYADHVARFGLRVVDMLNPESFRKKLRRTLDEAHHRLTTHAHFVEQVMRDNERLSPFWENVELFNLETTTEYYTQYGHLLRPYIAGTDVLVRQAVSDGKRVLLEGAQATLLSIDHGLYPMVTSSDSTIMGLANGVGLLESQVDRTFTIVKAPYMTRVGSGVFPTEMDEKSAGLIRKWGNEFGATTGRARRIGWLDLPLLRYALQFGGGELVLTKVDVLDECADIKLCTHYIYQGSDYDLGDRVLRYGEKVEVAFGDDELMGFMVPQYTVLAGWKEPIKRMTSGDELPPAIQKIIRFVQKAVDRPVSIVSVGPDREQTIVL